jgi:SAM-dependent methyltransferase
MHTLLVPVALALMLQTPASKAPPMPPTEQMMQQAAALSPQITTPFGRALRGGFGCLRPIQPMVAYYNKKTREALSADAAAKMTAEQLADFEKREIDTQFYYYTRYGTPVAFARPAEILGRAGITGADGLKLVDFGFGSIGQLHALASMGADVTGIEVDKLLEVMYAGEAGKVKRCPNAGEGREGSITLAYGQFPKDPAIVKQVGTGYDAFVSKNTLKRGYIHPEKEVDPRMLVHLDVDDETFVRAVYDALKPGGLFLIYNLCPAPSKPDEPYKPWGDGRSPFSNETFQKVGFKVLAFDMDDTDAARAMGKTLGWDSDMDLANDLFGTYTLVQKPR